MGVWSEDDSEQVADGYIAEGLDPGADEIAFDLMDEPYFSAVRCELDDALGDGGMSEEEFNDALADFSERLQEAAREVRWFLDRKKAEACNGR